MPHLRVPDSFVSGFLRLAAVALSPGELCPLILCCCELRSRMPLFPEHGIVLQLRNGIPFCSKKEQDIHLCYTIDES